MDLTLEQLRSITLGAVWIRQQEKGIVFSRFTDEQLALYDNTTIPYQENFHNTIRYNAGIRLSFRTNSRSLYIAGYFYKEREVRRHFSVDVMVDGKYLDSLDNFTLEPLHGRYIDEQYEMGDYEKTFDLGQGEKTVCVHFPWSIMPVFRHIALDDGASLIPVRPQKKLLAYGDSITQGFDALRPYNRQIGKLADMLDAEEISKACGGECFYEPLARLKDDFIPDYIYVAYGTNDWGKKTYEDFMANCRGFFAGLRQNYPDAPIIVVTPIWRRIWQTQKEFGPFHSVEQGIREAVAAYEGIHVIRGFDLVPHDPVYFSDWGLHPNDAGFAYYAENLLRAVRELPL